MVCCIVADTLAPGAPASQTTLMRLSRSIPRRRAALLALFALPLAGCGKRGDPVPPGPDEAITYPRTYPRDETSPRTTGQRVIFPPAPGVRR